ncbi:MAG: FtsX-like permease family protein [Acidobacteria bacterium]|nr:FtsX-like permease family protein [Acidobacteriota bacterium]
MKRDDDLNRELRDHLEMEAEELRAGGLPPAQAAAAARRAFGSPSLAAERTRDVWRWTGLAAFGKNVRFSFRRAAANPGFTATVTLVIALAVGASTALFSFADAALFKPLPYREQEKLLAISVQFRGDGGQLGEVCCTGADWKVLAANATTFQRAVYSGMSSEVNLAMGDRATLVKQQRVGRDFFATLGVPPVRGRSFSEEEDTPGGGAAVVLSDALSRRLFGADSDPIGQKVLLKGEPFEVVGVMPPAFYSGIRADLWTPLRASTSGEGGGSNFGILIRPMPGISMRQVEGELANLSRELPARVAKNGSTSAKWYITRPLVEARGLGLRAPLLVLLSAVGIVLLIGAVNVGGLLLARQSGRAAELATRMALGASSGQIFSEVLLDSVVLIALGGLLAIPAAGLALSGLKALTYEMTSIADAAALDERCMAVAATLTLVAGLVAGLFPAWQATRMQPRAGAARGFSGRKRRIPLGALVLAQVAMVVPLLMGAALLGRSFLGLWTAPPGFDPDGVLLSRFSLQESRYADREKVDRLLREGVDQMSRLPGVEAAAAGLHAPMERWLNMGVSLGAKPSPGEAFFTSNMNYVTPNYFAALRIPVLRGRVFSESDTASKERVVIVNEAFVKLFMKDKPVLDGHLRVGNGAALRIVGVAGDTQQRGGWGSYGPLHPMPAIFVPAAQVEAEFLRVVHQWFSPVWVVRTKSRPEALARPLEDIMRGLDPMLPLAKFTTPDELKSLTLGTQKLTVTLIAAISGLGLILCVLGIYGLVSSGVAERTREVGIRLALGATRSRVVRSAMRPGLLWAAGGVALGVPLAYAGREAVSKLLYNVKPTDTLALGILAAVLLLAVAASSFLPALKLARLDPAITLRDE